MKLRDVMCAIHERIRSENIAICFGVVQNLFLIVIVNHIAACIWYKIGTGSGSFYETNWINHYSVVDRTLLDKYLLSVHWTITQFTPASMSIQPQNVMERFFAVCMILFGLFAFSTFVSSITASMTRLRTLTADGITQEFRLKKFLRV